MIKYIAILDKLNASLDFLESGNEDVLVVAEKGIRLAKDVLMEFRKEIISNQFDPQLDEIHFYSKNDKYH